MMDFLIFVLLMVVISIVSGYLMKDGPSWQIMTLGLTIAVVTLIRIQQIESVYIILPVLLIGLLIVRGDS